MKVSVLWPSGKQWATARLSATVSRQGLGAGLAPPQEAGKVDEPEAGAEEAGRASPGWLSCPRHRALVGRSRCSARVRPGSGSPCVTDSSDLEGVVQSSVDAEGAVVPFLLCQQDKVNRAEQPK